MSTATAFKSIGYFPFCVTDVSGSSTTWDYVDNLTLTQVMAFYWNLETLSLSTTGTATVGAATADGTQTTDLNPVASTHYTRGSADQGGWFPAFADTRTFASWPAFTEPMERVCNDQTTPGAFVRISMDVAVGSSFLSLSFKVGTDPVNSGKYRIYCFFILSYAASSGSDNAEIRWQNLNVSTAGFTAITTGTFTVLGHTFSYRSLKTVGASHTDGTMSASSSSYTY